MSEVNRDATGPVTAGLFDRLAAGDKNAVEDLLIHFKDRLRRLTKKMFNREDRLPDLHQTDDIEQGAVLRLLKAIDQAKPTTKLHFMRLAATCIRRELCDLARKEYGEQGDGSHAFAKRPGGSDKHDEQLGELVDPATGPQTQAGRDDLKEKIHEKAQELPALELEVFDLIYYSGLTHEEVAALLGVSASTVKRRWHDAHESLHALLSGTGPTTTES